MGVPSCLLQAPSPNSAVGDPYNPIFNWAVFPRRTVGGPLIKKGSQMHLCLGDPLGMETWPQAWWGHRLGCAFPAASYPRGNCLGPSDR